MSTALREALATGAEYIQSPVDDLHSFMWTALWATIFSPEALGDSAAEKNVRLWRAWLGKDGPGREAVLNKLAGSALIGHSPLVKAMSSLLRKWRRNLEDLTSLFEGSWKVPGLDSQQKLLLYHRFALEGVADYAELLVEQRKSLGCPP